MDLAIIKSAITSLKSFDRTYSTKKVDKYLLNVIKENPKLNEKNVLHLSTEFIFDTIFDIDEEEEEEQLSVIQEKLEETKEVLNEVEKRRQEIMLRKNQIRQRQIGKSAKRRSPGAMA